VLTDGVVASLHVDYKNYSRIKQDHKEGRARRTETTIHNTRNFGIGKLLKNLPELRQVGFQPTDVYWTSKRYPTIVPMAKTRLRRWSVPSQ